MAAELQVRRVEVSFVGLPPTQRMERAAGVSEVEIDCHTLRCVVSGSFQPFLEALRGHEVINLSSAPISRPNSAEVTWKRQWIQIDG